MVRYNKSVIDSFIKNYPYEFVEALRYNSLKPISKLNKNNILFVEVFEKLIQH